MQHQLLVVYDINLENVGLIKFNKNKGGSRRITEPRNRFQRRFHQKLSEIPPHKTPPYTHTRTI